MATEKKEFSTEDRSHLSAVLDNSQSVTEKVSKLAQWFEIDLTIKIFGVEIVSWHFPPKDSSRRR